MEEFPVPVRVIGPGSQPAEGDAVRCLGMPRDVSVFRMPVVPDRAEGSALVESRDALAAFHADFERWDPSDGKSGPRLDLARQRADVVATTNQMLGEGEVSVRVDGARALRIQESVFTGLWRVCEYAPDGTLAGDWLEAAPLPRVVIEAARAAASPRLAPVALPQGAMNSPALIAEIGAQMQASRPEGRAHVVNLSLLPLTPEDHAVLQAALPVGPVALISRGFGNCRITATALPYVWWVQYFNNMEKLILNSIEIVDVPAVALAAKEDYDETIVRLDEWIASIESALDD